ncbi:integral membrane sensor signal transduction histidine kinase [Candidatus Magnetoovum chiemensis]|nr:integral membrane sensor signal transduction histidine kinase [Candidatus Magnetoovum chiemensis]
MKLYAKTTIILLLLSLTPILIVSIASYFIAESIITTYVNNNLEAIANIQKSRIETSIQTNIEKMNHTTSRPNMRAAFERYLKNGDKPLQDNVIKVLSDIKSSIKCVRDIYILDAHGTAAASTNASINGIDLSKEEYFIKGLKGYSMNVFSLDSSGAVINYLSCPLFHDGRLLGVVVIECSFKHVETIINDYTGMGQTGEIVLAKRNKNGDALFIANLRFDKKAALKKTIPKNNLTLPITQALLKNETIFHYTHDYRGASVIAATRYIEETDWGLVVKIDRDEAFSQAYRLRNFIIIFVFITTAAGLITSFLLSRSITSPIISLTKAAKRIKQGDTSKMADIVSTDEIGFLSKTFNEMTVQLLESNKKLEKDITERIKLEEQNKEILRTIQKRVDEEVEKSRLRDQLMYEQSRHIAMGELLVNIAHQWRQPLTAIALLVQDIKDAYAHNELNDVYMNKNVDAAMSEIKGLSYTLDNFSNYYINAQQKDEFNIAKEIDRALSLIKGYFEELGAAVYRNIPESIVIFGSPNEFSQVILNILTNVKDAFENKNIKNGVAKINAYKDENSSKIIITIEDNGGGVDDDK